jgi:hypothetical protein
MEWALKRRWTYEGNLELEMLDSPIARQSKRGRITIGEATLTWGNNETAWLLAVPEKNKWIACYHGDNSTQLSLSLPDGQLEIDEISLGWIVWDNGIVTIQATYQNAEINGGQLA